MIESVNYIVTFYCGKRRMYNSETPCIDFANSHINFINENMPNIGLVSFVISKCNCPIDSSLITFIEKQNKNFNYEVIVRENKGISYGGFYETIKKNHQNFEYSFIIEDDYIPVQENFINFFQQKMDTNTVYVCSLYRNKHASICNGLISNKLASTDFSLMEGNINFKENLDYNTANSNQRYFMVNYEKVNLKISDITDVGHTLYKHYKNIITYGDKDKPLLIKPI